MASSAVARETFLALRREIARIEGRLADRLETPSEVAILPTVRAATSRLRTGAIGFDAALGGGLPLSGLTEMHGRAMRDAGAVAGFALGLARLLPDLGPVLWIGTSQTFGEAGRPYAPGLAAQFGLSAERLLFGEAPKPANALWMAEEAASIGAFAAILLELDGNPAMLDLTATLRLHRRALFAGRPLFLIRNAGMPQPTAAPIRLLVAASSARERTIFSRPLAGSIGPPSFQVTIDKNPAALLASFTMEWSDGAFHERKDASRRPADHGVVVPASPGGADHAPASRPVVALPRNEGHPASGVQPARKQYTIRRRA
jgi:protein ImuA